MEKRELEDQVIDKVDQPKPKRKYTKRADKVVAEKDKKQPGAKMDKLEAGYQQTVRMQLSQIKELITLTDNMQSDVMTLKAERDELARGLVQVRKSIDSLYKILHEGE